MGSQASLRLAARFSLCRSAKSFFGLGNRGILSALNLNRSWLLVLALIVLMVPSARAFTLYSTEFEEFAVGADRWVGTNGWLGSSTGVGVHGIDQDILPGLGKTAFLGYQRPKSTFVTVFRPVLVNPLTNGLPIVEFETLMGIQDSTNGYRDSFFFTFYNNLGNMLGAIRFDNTVLSYGIWRLDGAGQVDTGVDFVRSELHLLFASIDFAHNVWSADLDGIPLFAKAPFNATTQALDLGYVAAEWQLTASSTNQHGDNWMLVADWAVRALPDSGTPFHLESMGVSTDGFPSMTWTGTYGFDYAVEYSPDLRQWTNGLPNGTFSNVAATTPLTFTDVAPATGRHFRVRRSFAP